MQFIPVRKPAWPAVWCAIAVVFVATNFGCHASRAESAPQIKQASVDGATLTYQERGRARQWFSFMGQ